MTALVNSFALIGRSFPSEGCDTLRKAVAAARADRKVRRPDRIIRAWRAAQDAIVLPKKLSA